MRATLLLLAPALGGCASRVITEYSDLRLETLADPGPVADDWAPDAAIVLSPNVVEQIVGAAVKAHGDLTGQLEFSVPLVGTATLTPELHVTDLAIGPAAHCTDCVAVMASLEGGVGWRLGRNNGRAPVTATADLDTEFVTTRQGDGSFLVTARPREIRNLDVKVAGSVTLLGPLLGTELGRWLQGDLGDWIAPIPLGTVGGEDVPLRAARVRGAGKGVGIDLLTRSSTPVALPMGEVTGVRGWELRITTDSLLDVARRESFLYGPVGHGVVADPTSLEVTPEGLVLGLRLWWTKGRGWWRDYDIHLALALTDTDVRLEATSVDEAAHSRGAAWADPLAALAEGKILEGLERSIHATAPAGWSGSAGDISIEAVVRELTGEEGIIRITGDLRASPASGEAAEESEPTPDPLRKPRRPSP